MDTFFSLEKQPKLPQGQDKGNPWNSTHLEETKSCVYAITLIYIWIKWSNFLKLLLSFIKPQKGITTQTISRWILEVFDLLGINIKGFTNHSSGSASTSKAKASGLSSNDILEKECIWEILSKRNSSRRRSISI